MNAELLKNAKFRKADGSGDVGCVEVAFAEDTAGVRDSKHVETSPVLAFAGGEWRGFVRQIKRGRFDL